MPQAPTMTRYLMENERGEQMTVVLCKDCAADEAIDYELTPLTRRACFGNASWYCGKTNEGEDDLICQYT